MRFHALKIPGAFRIELSPIEDERGSFFRTYDHQIMKDNGLITEWAQESQSVNRKKNIVRGIHFQNRPHVEAKLIQINVGTLFDVIVDLRKDSPTFGKYESLELSDNKYEAIYIPKGCGHAFCTLTDFTVLTYKMSAPFTPELYSGIRWNDPELNIQWPLDGSPLVSDKDNSLPLLKDAGELFLL